MRESCDQKAADLLSSAKASWISVCICSSSACLRFRNDSMSASRSATSFTCNHAKLCLHCALRFVHPFPLSPSFHSPTSCVVRLPVGPTGHCPLRQACGRHCPIHSSHPLMPEPLFSACPPQLWVDDLERGSGISDPMSDPLHSCLASASDL